MVAAAPVRIAMWSGPRNISTALMRSWGNREDTHVVDEPFYAHYLTREQVDHPGVDEIVAIHETDWRKVVEQLTGPLPAGKSVLYSKQMTHHLLGEIDRGWMRDTAHCFLIRDPREVLNSLVKHLPFPTVRDTGFPQQSALYDYVAELRGEAPPVVDARDLLTDPEGVLRVLCDRVGVPFSERMLSWPAGPRETDGVWAKHWYANVEASTGFAPYRPREDTLAPEHTGVFKICLQHYRKLYPHRLVAAG